MLVCAADHGHSAHGTSLFGSQVSAQVAAAAARGETAAGVLAADGGHELLVADIGLRGAAPDGVVDRKVAAGSADMSAGDALTRSQLQEALAAGRGLVAQLAEGGRIADDSSAPGERRAAAEGAPPTASSSARSGSARLGETSGALLALPLIERAGLLHDRMATFAEAGVDDDTH